MMQWIDGDFYMKQTLTHPKSVSKKNDNNNNNILFRSVIISVKCFAIIIYLFRPRNHYESQMLTDN